MDIGSFGLKESLVSVYRTRGVNQLYEWQSECLSLPGVLEGNRNLIYCAPTSGGKTLVSEIVMLRRLAGDGRRALFVLPYISVVSEKEAYLQSLCRPAQYKVQAFYG
ncbi:hypothetical protein FOZ62_008048, partial [Perkinsus olseni]